jgi:hypothetical protein
LRCLADAFLSEDVDELAVLPTGGRCPGCRRYTKWIDIVKELGLRTRTALPTVKDPKDPKDDDDESDDQLRERIAADLRAREFAIEGEPLSDDDYREIEAIIDLIQGDDDESSEPSEAKPRQTRTRKSRERVIADSQGESESEAEVEVSDAKGNVPRARGKPKAKTKTKKREKLVAIVEGASSDWDDVETIV